MKPITLLLIAVGLASCSPRYSEDVCQALKTLDNVLEESSSYERFKNRHIESIKAALTSNISNEERYRIYDELYNEYIKYDLDSANLYVRIKEDIASRSAMEHLILDARLDALDKYSMSGQYHEVLEDIDKLDTNVLRAHGFMPRYCHILNSLYLGMAYTADNPRKKSEYKEQQIRYRQRLYNLLGEDDIAKLYVRTEILIEEKCYEQVKALLHEGLQRPSLSIHDKAILHYLSAKACINLGETEEAIIHYAESAICDISTPIRDYKSLYELAEFLYKASDTERAYRYITRSIDDAKAANMRINIDSINNLLPIIFNSYELQINSKERYMVIAMICIMAILLIVILISCVIIRDRRTIAERERIINKSHEELQTVNERLHRYIARLKESNEIKEAYIGRYIDLCSDYIGRLEQYRSELRKLAKSGGLDTIMSELRSSAVIEAELTEFYQQFDATFLDLFPDFIAQLNSLLKPDKQIEVKHSLLSTELRICALIRLGVTDSVKIAEFLRRSVSTIYNYRVKMRNAYVNDREDFEKEIMKIGK